MARIRSIHPGMYTDEAFMELSMAARVFFPGLLVYADDRGVFEWKVKTLKAQIFPGDNIDVTPLLAELVALDQVREYEIDGKKYGAIRNFRRWQRPQKPKYSYPVTGWVNDYVQLKDGADAGNSATDAIDDNDDSNIGTVPVQDQSRTGTGKSFQREDGGGRREEVGGKVNSDRSSLADSLGRAERAPPTQKGTRLPADFQVPEDWIDDAAARRQAHQLPEIDLRLEAERFTNYWTGIAGHRGCKLDWRATWRTWVLRAGTNGTANRYNGRAESAIDRDLRALAGMAQSGSGDSRPPTPTPAHAERLIGRG